MAKVFHANLQKCRLVILEADQGLINHPHRALDLAEIAENPERRGQLNQPFEKRLMGIVGLLVKGFQNIVAFKELSVVKQTYALSQPNVHKISWSLKLPASQRCLKLGTDNVRCH